MVRLCLNDYTRATLMHDDAADQLDSDFEHGTSVEVSG